MTIEAINQEIENIEAGLESRATPEGAKTGMKKVLEELKEKRKKMEQEEPAPEPEKKAKPDAKPASKKRPRMSQADKDACDTLMKEVQSILNKYRATKPKKPTKPNTKKVSTKVAEGVVSTVATAVRKEITKEKVNGIKLDHLREARDHGEQMLKALRRALGGISDSNDTFLKTFSKQFNDLIKEVEEKRKEVKK